MDDLLRKYHKLSDRHVLVLEADMPYCDVLHIVKDCDKLRKAGNELVAIMRKNLEQLNRTKRYRKLWVRQSDDTFGEYGLTQIDKDNCGSQEPICFQVSCQNKFLCGRAV